MEDRAARFAFLTPLMPRSRAVDWDRVEENLARTMASVQNSSDGRFLSLIVHHEKPAGEYWNDPRVVSIPVSHQSSGSGHLSATGADQRYKKKTGATWLRSQGHDGLYVMFLDADDLVHIDLVKFVLEDDNGEGYWLPHGYAFDVTNGIGVPTLDDFHHRCGSSFIGFFHRAELPASPNDDRTPFSRICDARHIDHQTVAKSLGKKVKPVPFMGVAYIRNHPNSVAQRREKRERVVRRGLMRLRGTSQYIVEQEFGGVFAREGVATWLWSHACAWQARVVQGMVALYLRTGWKLIKRLV